jgi:hypothetical protein
MTAIQKPTIFYGAVAQLGERFPCTEEVVGSIPISSTIMLNQEENIMDEMTFVDYKFYLNGQGDIAFDEGLDTHQLRVRQGDLLRVSRDVEGRICLQRYGHVSPHEND